MSGFAGRVGTAPNAAGRQIALPNQTIYINNINDKLSKELLRRFVYAASGARRGRTRHHHAQARDARCSARVSVITSHCTHALRLPGFHLVKCVARGAIAARSVVPPGHRLTDTAAACMVQRAVRPVLAVRRCTGCGRHEDAKNARAGLCGLSAPDLGVGSAAEAAGL